MGHLTAELAANRADPVLLRTVLRLIGSFSLLAVVFVVVPTRVMGTIHAAVGLGSLPTAPVVSYLARSTSAFYAILGGLFWILSFDLPRYRPVLIYLGGAIACFGVALVVVDWTAGLPLAWKLWEGPFVTVLGLTILILSRRLQE